MLSDDLKAQTRPQHDAAEASPAMRAVLADDLARPAYRDHLARLLGFYGPLEPALSRVDGLRDHLPDLDARLVKAGWLAEDLDALGPGPSAPAGPAPAYALADALGALYVVEGSTLGGRIIEKHLARTLGVSPDDGARFYHSYGEQRGDRWKALKAALDAFGEAHPDARPRVVAAAGDTFDALRTSMEIPLDETAHA